MQISELMTDPVVTASSEATIGEVAGLMREHNVGSVVICDGGRPVSLITDRDVALAVAGDGIDRGQPVGPHATHPVVTGEVGMDLEEAAALMMQHHIRRLPIMDGEHRLAGIVTLDDIAVKAGDLQLTQRMTTEVAKAALPEFFFHQRGG